MTFSDPIILKAGKEKPILQRHHWIFSGAAASLPRGNKGSILPVQDSSGKLLGHAMFNPHGSIIGRMVSFGNHDPLEIIQSSIRNACESRLKAFDQSATNAFRLINGEGDFLPGLVVDNYNGVLVVQLLTLGMDKIRRQIFEQLISVCQPSAIYEKSLHGSRKEEGLDLQEGIVYGKEFDEIEIIENGIRFLVSPKKGQKTGFFLDQRRMRKEIGTLSKGKKVLNCFSYTGGFTLYALAGGASQVVSVETSEPAREMERQNIQLNGLPIERHTSSGSDVFDYLKKSPLDFDLVILDPPAYAKKRLDLNAACRGYREINKMAMEKMPAGSILLTCSCSAHISSDLFQKVVFQAAAASGRNVQIIGRHQLAEDHPINICHPETEYLKSLLLYVR